VKVNCRIITATNKKLEDMVDEGRFRRDLFYRINVVNIVVPPLRDRRDDIPLLSDYFLKRYEEMYNRDSLTISPRLMDMFLKYAWPGNVRELENNIKRLIILGNEAQLIAEMERKREDAPPVLIPGGDGGYLSRPEAIDRIPAMNFTAGYGDNAMEPEEGSPDPGHKLQGAALQDQGVRPEPGVTDEADRVP
jgi:DNA-binding NtrC family response regulator